MGFGIRKKPVRKFYIKLEKDSKEEIIEALKTKQSWTKRGRKPSGLIIKGKRNIPTKILEDLFDLKKVDIDIIQCKVGLHDWTEESMDGRKFCKKCFDWRVKQ
jgi:hypothetical protein